MESAKRSRAAVRRQIALDGLEIDTRAHETYRGKRYVRSIRARPCTGPGRSGTRRQCRFPKSASVDRKPRDRRDEPAAPVPDDRQLLLDLRRQVPGQDEHIVRLRRQQRLRITDRNMAPRRKPTLLHRRTGLRSSRYRRRRRRHSSTACCPWPPRRRRRRFSPRRVRAAGSPAVRA